MSRDSGGAPPQAPTPVVSGIDDEGRHERWYVPADEGDETRFLRPDGRLALHLVPYRDSWGGEGFRL